MQNDGAIGRRDGTVDDYGGGRDEGTTKTVAFEAWQKKETYEINSGEYRGDDGKLCDEDHGGIHEFRRGWAELEISLEKNKSVAPDRKCGVS